MTHGAPDWIRRVEVVVIVENVPVSPIPAKEVAITELARVAITSTSYQTVVSWTVSSAKQGVLRFIELMSDDYTHTRFKLTIAGVVKFTDIQLDATLSLEYPDVHLSAGQVVLLQAKSDDGTAINVSGDIIGKEVG